MSTLDELVVSGAELDRELVATILKPFVRIDRETCAIIPQDRWESLTVQRKVLVFLAARKAMRALDFGIAREECSPMEIEAATGVRGGTLRSALKRLADRRTIDKRQNGGYYVPNWALQRVKAALIEPMEASE